MPCRGARTSQCRRVICNGQHWKPGIIALLSWNMMVNFGFALVVSIPLHKLYQNKTFNHTLMITLSFYCIVGMVQVLYPVSGLMADVCCGRYRIITLSLFSVWLGGLFGGAVGLAFAITSKAHVILDFLTAVGLLAFFVGAGGFRANSVQFSHDQLLDVSSENISLFLHWFVWTEYVGEMANKLLSSWMVCDATVEFKLVISSSALTISLPTFMIIVSCLLRKSLHRERNSSNPYWNVWKVLRFTVEHSKPLGHRSAFTYCEDDLPSRMDLAKRIFGGPFETETVEDVKTFLRIVVMLFVITLVFSLQISASYLFSTFGRHLGNSRTNSSCTFEWILLESGNLYSIISVIAIPLYLCLVYPVIKKWIPRILVRMGVGILLKVASICSMFTILSVYNYLASQADSAESRCLFLDDRDTQNASHSKMFPTEVLLVTHLLYGIAAPLINITVFEFISAQSPYPMKGLLLGVYYAFRGLFITLGSAVTFPFVQESLWEIKNGMFTCGFYYYLSNSLIGVIGLAVFVLVARWYHYRERDDPPYRYQYVEDYYQSRMIASSSYSYGTVERI